MTHYFVYYSTPCVCIVSLRKSKSFISVNCKYSENENYFRLKLFSSLSENCLPSPQTFSYRQTIHDRVYVYLTGQLRVLITTMRWTLKMHDLKMQDLKMTDQIARHENGRSFSWQLVRHFQSCMFSQPTEIMFSRITAITEDPPSVRAFSVECISNRVLLVLC